MRSNCDDTPIGLLKLFEGFGFKPSVDFDSNNGDLENESKWFTKHY